MEQQRLFADEEVPAHPPIEANHRGRDEIVELMAKAIVAVHVARREAADDVDVTEG